MVNAYSQKIFQGSKPVFDGRKNLYSRESLPIGKDKVKKLKESCIYSEECVKFGDQCL